MTLFNKLKWVIGILMIFVLILGTNLIDRRNFIKVKDSLTTIYEDRLAASEILFNISDELHRLKTTLMLPNSTASQHHISTRLDTLDRLVVEFDKTRLVQSESYLLTTVRDNLALLRVDLLDVDRLNKKDLAQQVDVLLTETKKLNKIQLSEGKKQFSRGERAVQTIEFFTQIEVYVLITLAIVIMVIIMYQPKKNIQ